jgi:hypothetical protein
VRYSFVEVVASARSHGKKKPKANQRSPTKGLSPRVTLIAGTGLGGLRRDRFMFTGGSTLANALGNPFVLGCRLVSRRTQGLAGQI